METLGLYQVHQFILIKKISYCNKYFIILIKFINIRNVEFTMILYIRRLEKDTQSFNVHLALIIK